MNDAHASSAWHRTARGLVVVWLALLVLLLASLSSAWLRLGVFNLVAGLVIAAVKIGLITRRFMHLDRAPPWSGLAVLVAACALALLAGLTVFEAATRPADPAAFQQPRQLPPLRPASATAT